MSSTRTKNQQVRVHAAGLCSALRAAAAFTDADKKSHRHRINLRAATWQANTRDGVKEVHGLIVAGGAPVRALAAVAGTFETAEEFAVDIRPSAAAQIVKLFTHAGGVELKSDGKKLTITAVDAMFDNQQLAVRIVPLAGNADAVTVVARALHLSEDGVDDVEVSSATAVCIAQAAKAVSGSPLVRPVRHGGVDGAVITIGGGVTAFARAVAVPLPGAGVAFMSLAEQVDLPEPWLAGDVTLQHVLDAALPIRVKPVELAAVPDAEDEPAGVDLDAADADAADDDSDAGAA